MLLLHGEEGADGASVAYGALSSGLPPWVLLSALAFGERQSEFRVTSSVSFG